MSIEDTQAVYRHAQLGHVLGFGQRPAIIVVDMQLGFTDPARSVLAADAGREIEAINTLLTIAHKKALPVFFTVIAYQGSGLADAGLWPQKAPSLATLREGTFMIELDGRLLHRPEDVLIVKKQASAFFGTPLASLLTATAIDTVIVVGCTTSGCVRATVVDAIAHGFRPIVPREAVGDRAPEPHENSLFDMSAKYADVLEIAEVARYLSALGATPVA